MNDIKIFENEDFGKIRTIIRDDEVWFVAKDISDVLNYSDTSKMCERLDDDEKVVLTLENIRNLQIGGLPDSVNRLMIINESGLYNAIIGSRKEEAKVFKKWVTGEVLPSIRKHGIYATDSFVEQALSNPDVMIDVLQKFKIERQKRIEAEKTVTILTHVQKTYTATELAKELNMKSAIALNKKLEELKIQFKQNNTYVLYSQYSNLGYTEIKQTVLDNGAIVYDRRFTQRGREFIVKMLNKDMWTI